MTRVLRAIRGQTPYLYKARYSEFSTLPAVKRLFLAILINYSDQSKFTGKWADKLCVDRFTELLWQQRGSLDRGVLLIQDSVADANSGSG
jgi:hypothetical protein